MHVRQPSERPVSLALASIAGVHRQSLDHQESTERPRAALSVAQSRITVIAVIQTPPPPSRPSSLSGRTLVSCALKRGPARKTTPPLTAAGASHRTKAGPQSSISYAASLRAWRSSRS